MIPEKFSENIVFEKLEQIQNRLQEEEVREKIQLEFLSFYDSVIEYISERLNITVPLLVQEPEMNALASELEAALSQINSFLGNNNVGHLTNANTPCTKNKITFSQP